MDDSAKDFGRLRMATDAAGIGIWDWGVNDGSLFWNKSMYDLYGVDEIDFDGPHQCWRQHLHPDDRDAVQTQLRAALDGCTEFSGIYRVIWPDGSIHYLAVKATVHADERGVPLRMLGVNREVTDQALQEQLRESYDRLRRLEYTRDPLVKVLVHDMKTPLTIIGLSLDLIKAASYRGEHLDASLQSMAN